MRVQGANSGQPRGTQANSRREASPTSSCRHFKQFAAGSFPLDCFLHHGTGVNTGISAPVDGAIPSSVPSFDPVKRDSLLRVCVHVRVRLYWQQVRPSEKGNFGNAQRKIRRKAKRKAV